MTIDTERDAPGETAPVAGPATPRPYTERREAPRRLLRRSAKILLPDGKVLRARLIDLSEVGLSLFVEQALRGTTYQISFDLSVNGQLTSVLVTAKLVYSTIAGKDGFRVGFELESASEK